MDNYRLIIFGDDWDVYLTAYKELIDDPKISYIPTFRPKGWTGQLQRIQFNPKLNNIITIPFKEKWNPLYLRHIKKEEQPCFLILDKWLRMEGGIRLLPYLRKHYPKAPIVCYAQDLIETIIDVYSHKQIDVDYFKQHANLFISYDAIDAKKHGLLYHPTVFSVIPQSLSNHDIKYDLYFLGRDKGRLPLLINLCKEAKNRGIKCKMVMIEVPEKKRIAGEGFFYIDKSISYHENLENCAASNCIIELLQHNAQSPTLRTWEAIAMNKKLVTNNTSIRSTEVYDERYISIFNDEKTINWDFISSANAFSGQKNPYQEIIKPETLIRFIENKLQIQIERS
ncbi:MAG: hypothetical protein J6W43_10965 [Prevotella sp.]|nr:hypothetical protein [Prevotella sp.]